MGSRGRRVIRVELPFRGQHLLPDDVPDDIFIDREQLGERGVGVLEPVQQHLRHLSLLLPYQPGSLREFAKCEYCWTEKTVGSGLVVQ